LISVPVDICLATYNGAQFLMDFYASIVAQSHSEWRLLIRDDGSRDATSEIIEKLSRNDDRVVPVSDYLGNLGAVSNFSTLLGLSTAQYVMLADQDDVWYPNKIRASVDAISSLQTQIDDGTRPLLAFTDLRVVDEALNTLNESFICAQRLEKLRSPTFIQLLTQNVAPGCSMIMNRPLIDLALPIPPEAVMHDWWLILVAAALGGIGFEPQATLAYRQHDSNVIGAKAPSYFGPQGRLATYRSRLRRAQMQAAELTRRYADRMRDSDLAAALAFEALPRLPVGWRQLTAWRRGLSKAGTVRCLGFYLFM
jgi:glycosyltransferase involved in cell wall biosynthesis